VAGRKRLPDDGDERRPDDPAIVELLDSVREARTSLAIELSAAAGAIEAGHPEIARDIVAATAEEMRLVSDRPRAVSVDDERPRRRARRRALLALPAIPLVGAIAMTAASAIGGSGTPATHHPVATAPHVSIAAVPGQQTITTATTTGPIAHDVATSTLHRLEHVVAHHPQSARVLAVADDLHDQLTEMIATATNDPARLHVVRHLLMLEQHVLESVRVPGTQLALAASRAIVRLLDLVPTTHAMTLSRTSTAAQPAKPRPTATTSVAPTNSTSHTQAPASPSVPAAHAPSVMSKNALFGKGLFNRH
jgi:hypothetical protein